MTGREPDFYVGYRALPLRLGFILAGLVIGLLGILALDAALVARFQQAAGPGSWSDTAQTFEGTLVRDPYPVLWVERDGARTAYLLVADSKRSAEAVLEGLPSGPASISGQLVERDGLDGVKMIEVNPGGAKAGTSPALSVSPPVSVALATVKGEIVDSKCWLGVMRPGEGRVHKGCATVCILGGIPPALVTKGPDGAMTAYVLTDAAGAAIEPASIAEIVGDPVVVTGEVVRKGPLLFLRADLASLRRL
jgi:hypothetical protein